MSDPIRDQLWADVYKTHVSKGLIWFKAKEEANLAVEWYDRRPPPNQTATQPQEKQS